MRSRPEAASALARRVAERTLAWRFGQWYWGDAIAVDSLLEADRVMGAGPFAAEVVTRVEHWAHDAPETWEDSLAPGRAIFDLARKGMVSEAAPQRALRALRRLPRNRLGIPLLRPHVPEWRDLVWVDSLYHLPPALAAAARWSGSDALADEAVMVVEGTLVALDHPAGLAHSYDGGLDRTNGVAWSRGVCWALLGLLDLLECLGEKAPPSIAEAARRLFVCLARTQRADGSFRTVLDDAEAASEVSSAAFFVAAALHRCGVLDGARKAVELAADSVIASVDDDGVVHGVSVDTHARWEKEPYRHPSTGPSPWAQGSALRALVALSASKGET